MLRLCFLVVGSWLFASTSWSIELVSETKPVSEASDIAIEATLDEALHYLNQSSSEHPKAIAILEQLYAGQDKTAAYWLGQVYEFGLGKSVDLE